MAISGTPMAPAGQFQSPNIAPANQFQSPVAPSQTAVTNRVAPTLPTPAPVVPPPAIAVPKGLPMQNSTPAPQNPTSIQMQSSIPMPKQVPQPASTGFQVNDILGIPKADAASPIVNNPTIPTSVFTPQKVAQMRLTMADSTVLQNLYNDPTNTEFKAQVDKAMPYFNQQSKDWQQNMFPTAMLNDYYNATPPLPSDPAAAALLAGMTKQQPVPWWQHVENFVGNIPSDAVNTAGSILSTVSQPILHPIQTAGAIGDAIMHPVQTAETAANFGRDQLKMAGQAIAGTGEDIYQGLTGNQVPQFKAGGSFGNPNDVTMAQGQTPEQQVASQVGQSIEKHPVQTMMVAAPFISKLSEMTGLSDALSNIPAVQKLSSTMDAIKAAPGEIIKGALGATTGVGKGAIDEALKGAPEFAQGMRGDQATQLQNMVQDAKDAVDSIKEARTGDYLASKSVVGASNAELDPKILATAVEKNLQRFGIQGNLMSEDLVGSLKGASAEDSYKALGDAMKSPGSELDFSKSSIAPVSSNAPQMNRINEAVQYVQNQITNPENNTALGWDRMKQGLDSLIKNDGSKADSFITSLKNSVKNATVGAVPEYGKMLSGYEDASNQINEIQKALGTGNRTSIDTSIRKMTAAMRTGNQGNEYRNALLQNLEEVTGKNLRGRLAGTAMSTYTPRGLAGVAEGGGVVGVLAHVLSPAFITALPFASPRIVGEVLNKIGVMKSAFPDVMDALRAKSAVALSANNILKDAQTQ